MEFILIILLFLMLYRTRQELQDEMKKYLTKKEWEKWLEDDACKPKIRRVNKK